MTSEPVLSICISTYNRGEKVEALVRNILNISSQEMTVVAVDDHSSDDTAERLSDIQDTRFHFYRNATNQGARGNWFVIKDENIWPIIRDKFMEAGSVHNYFLQDLWAARLVYQNLPQEHYDIGSRLDGFIAHVLSFGVPVKMIDIRPFPEEIDGLETMVGNATDLKEFEDESMESLSALCSLEHFGLGRYGDPVDPEACFKCFENIQRKLKKGGNFYLALPVGRERVEFNAHRIFYASTIIECFHNLQLMEFSCAADKKIERDVEIHKYDQDTHDGEYRYGLFHFRKM